MKIMMFFHGGSRNRGCEAIVRSSTNMIKKQIDGAKICLVSNNPESDKIIPNLDGIYDGSLKNIKNFSLGWLISSFKVKMFGDESYAYRKIHRNVISQIDKMDVCLSIGGDNYCYGEQPGWYEVNKNIKAKGKLLVLWGCSIGEEDMSESKTQDLKTFDLILARESYTYQMLVKSGFKNVKLCADSAFLLEKEELELPHNWQKGNTIGLNYSPLVLQRNDKSEKAVRDLINYILASTSMTIALTPHVTEYGNNDYEVLKKLHKEFQNTGRVIILPDNLNAKQYKGYISRMRFFIGARTHATIAAYSSSVPTMVLGYSIKSRGIANDIFGEEKLVLNLNDLSYSSILISKFEEMVNDEIKIREKLNQSIPNMQKMSIKAVDYLNELVK